MRVCKYSSCCYPFIIPPLINMYLLVRAWNLRSKQAWSIGKQLVFLQHIYYSVSALLREVSVQRKPLEKLKKRGHPFSIRRALYSRTFSPSNMCAWFFCWPHILAHPPSFIAELVLASRLVILWPDDVLAQFFGLKLGRERKKAATLFCMEQTPSQVFSSLFLPYQLVRQLRRLKPGFGW